MSTEDIDKALYRESERLEGRFLKPTARDVMDHLTWSLAIEKRYPGNAEMLLKSSSALGIMLMQFVEQGGKVEFLDNLAPDGGK